MALSIDRALDLFDIPTNSTYSSIEQDILATTIQSYLNDPQNKSILKSEKGQILKKKQIKLLNLIEVRKAFTKCLQTNESRRNLYLRIYTAAAKVEEIKIDCNVLSTEFKDIKAFSNYIQSISDSVGLNDLQGNIHKNSFKNLIKTYLFFKHSFKDEVSPVDTVNKLCQSSYGKNLCSDESRKEYYEFAKNEKTFLEKQPVYSFEEARVEINQNISELNTELKKVKPKVDKGWFNNFMWDSSDPLYDEKSEKALSNYQELYLANATSGIGSLMMSETAKNIMGRMKSKDQDEVEHSNPERNTTSYDFSPHSELSSQDIKNSYQDVISTIEKQAKSLNRLEVTREFEQFNMNKNNSPYADIDLMEKIPKNYLDNRRRDIKRLIKTNPAAIGELLASSPEYSSMVCDLIKEIEEDDDTDEAWDKVFFWGGIVVGGALMVTGLVALGGVMLARTLASAALFKTVGSYVTVVGAVSGLGESAYFTKELAYAKLEMSLMEEAFMSGLGDEQNIIEAKESLKDFNEAKFNLALTLGFTAIDIAGFMAIMKGARIKKNTLISPEKEKILKLNNITSTLKEILGSNKRVKQFLKLIDVFGPEDVVRLLGILGSIDGILKNKIFSILDLGDLKEIKQLMKNTQRSLKECSK